MPQSSPASSPSGRRSARRRRRPWSLRTRLVVSAVGLIAVVCAVIGTVTTIALHTYLYDQVDKQLSGVATRIAGPPFDEVKGPRPGGQWREDIRDVVAGPGQPMGTVAAEAEGGVLSEGAISRQHESSTGEPKISGSYLTAAQLKALSEVPQDGSEHTVDIPGKGEYRVKYVVGGHGDFVVGISTAEAQNTVDTLILAEISVTAAGLVAAGIAGAVMVGISLRPLRRVAATATRVSELPLHSGEVALHERVPMSEADPRTEVGQVGAALNRMLGHVESALAARQESETRVRQFVADASHELRTPLASIRGYAELTRRGREEIGPDTRHALGRVESEAARMTGLVEDLLLLARLDAGRPVERAEVDLSPVVVDAVSDARAAGPDHKWRLELPDDPAVVYGDDARLRQVLVNLLANARTHTPPGTTVTARVLWRGPYRAGHGAPYPAAPYPAPYPAPYSGFSGYSAPCVSLEVEDDGPGIPPHLLPHVFERFARGDASRSRAAGSTGLGLAIVHAVVTAHGGQVTVDSVPGRTVFGVHLPVDPPAGQAVRQSVHHSAHQAVHHSVTHSQPRHRLTTQP
ncbi:putative two component system sensor kinase [Streptomyces bingchenggensis BCW-1]|uniref:histidine kinase n=1 Tax=Streptomyces bingchenggensis (strain BCW-1) TaxID=749414 RepID=D7C6X4_STRBB|nr:HAMP domain-containing sensor histidine kinase [Streptomyces milbemycinicus]ADI08361.1 putative two component system sensor kinase [Streptomyces bingchenggensis BCW-1]